MKKMNRVFMGIAAAITVSAIGNPVIAEEEPTIKIAYCVPNLDDTNAIVTKICQAYVDELNAQDLGYKVEYAMFNSNQNLETQIVQVESIITNDFDVMIFFPSDTSGALSIIQQAMDAGVAVIDKNGSYEPGTVDCVFYGTNEQIYADMLDEWLDKRYDATGEKLNAVVYGLMSQTPQLPRGDRRLEYAEANPDKVEIVATGAADWDAAKAMALVEDWIPVHPEMNAVFSANTDMAQGVIQALKTSGYDLNEFVISTCDVSSVSQRMLQDGEIDVVCGCDLWDETTTLIDVAIQIAQGTFEDQEYYLERMWCIDTENYNEYEEFYNSWIGKIADY